MKLLSAFGFKAIIKVQSEVFPFEVTLPVTFLMLVKLKLLK